MVDRAANKRRFAIVKREGAMPGEDMVIEISEGEGGSIVVKAAPPETEEAKAQKAKDEEAKAQKAKADADAEEAQKAAAAEEAQKAKAETDLAEKAKDEAFSKAVQGAAEELKSLVASGKGKPADLAAVLSKLGKLVPQDPNEKRGEIPVPGTRKQVTGPRAAKLIGALKALGELSKELGLDEEAKTKADEPLDKDAAAKAIGDAVAKAMEPVTKKMAEIETAMTAGRALGGDEQAKTETKKAAGQGFWGGITGIKN